MDDFEYQGDSLELEADLWDDLKQDWADSLDQGEEVDHAYWNGRDPEFEDWLDSLDD